MNAPDTALDWTTLNQRLLVAEFARLKARLEGDDKAAATVEVEAVRAALPEAGAIDTLTEAFGLSVFERDIVLLCAGAEMDSRLAALCAEAGGPGHRPWPSFALALAVLAEPHWSALAPVRPLRRWRLLEVLDEAGGLTAGQLRLDERVLHFVAGLNHLDQRLEPLLEAVPPAGLMCPAHEEVAACVVEQLRAAAGPLPKVLLTGGDAAGQQDVAATVAARLGIRLYRLRACDVPATAAEQAALAALWTREAALLGCGLLISHEDGDVPAAPARLAARIDALVVVTGPDATPCEGTALCHAVNCPDVPQRRRLWQAALGPRASALAPGLDTLASQYRLGARRIGDIAAQAQGHDAERDLQSLHRACRDGLGALPGMAQRIDVRAAWPELVLPETQRETLRQIAVQMRHRMTVHHVWGFASKSGGGLGISTLFWGESGTGKTLAAEVLAHELGLALYRIDLAAVVSKYIGETEKNLKRLFDGAEGAGAILLFDEADALFGKRSEVKDSHDRYANIEVSYLLQRMEAYGGLAILTTNHKTALDAAFQRRLRFVVQFPFPDQAQREGIWRAVFPAGTPLQGIDWQRLARLNAAGGTIRNIALSAAFLAAEEGSAVGMSQLLRGVQLEAAKRDKPFSETETRGWV